MTDSEVLKMKYNLVALDEKTAKGTLNVLDSYHNKGLYDYDNQKICGFYSKAMVELILKKYFVISFGEKEYFFENVYY